MFVDCVCGESVPQVEWIAHLNLPGKHATDTAFRPNIDGRPGKQEMRRRTERAMQQMKLAGRVIAVTQQDVMTISHWEAGVRILLMDRLGVTEEELHYYLALAQMNTYEEAAAAVRKAALAGMS